MLENGRSDACIDHVTTRCRASEPMKRISVRGACTDGSSELGTTTVRCITDGSRTAPYNRGSHRRRRGDGEKGAAGRDHDGAGEGPDTALATLAAEPPACERGGQEFWSDTVHGTAASRRCCRARKGLPAAETSGQSGDGSGDGG